MLTRVLALPLLAGTLVGGLAAQRVAGPNLVVILTDDQGYADVGFHGCKDIPTPHIDSIARDGVHFTHAYVSFPVCGPSRAGLITGRYQDRFGACRNPTIDPSVADNGVPRSERMLSELLRPLGFRNAIIGKWHLGTHRGLRPNDRGFDEFFGFLSGGHSYRPERLVIDRLEDVDKKYAWYRTRLLHNDTPVTIDRYLTHALSDAAVEFIQGAARRPGQPFFLYLAYNAPHTPMQAPEEELARFAEIEDGKRRKYAAMVHAVDEGVGRVLQALRDADLDERTLVVFATDNGGATTNASSNGQLRGHKGSPYEGGLRVPMAMRWTGTIPKGTVRHEPVITLDVAATMLRAWGVHREEIDAGGKVLDGVDLLPLLTGVAPGPPRDRLFWRMYDKGIGVIRDGHDKLIVRRDAEDEFYRLDRDPGEQSNLIASEDVDTRRRIDVLRGRLARWTAELREPLCPGLGTWEPGR